MASCIAITVKKSIYLRLLSKYSKLLSGKQNDLSLSIEGIWHQAFLHRNTNYPSSIGWVHHEHDEVFFFFFLSFNKATQRYLDYIAHVWCNVRHVTPGVIPGFNLKCMVDGYPHPILLIHSTQSNVERKLCMHTLKTGTPVEDKDPILKLLPGVSRPQIQLKAPDHCVQLFDCEFRIRWCYHLAIGNQKRNTEYMQ